MNATEAMTFHHKALLRLLATLFAAAGIVPEGEAVQRLSRSVRNRIQRVLLPLESAARRLIFFRAERMVAPPVKARKDSANADRLGDRKKKRRKRGPSKSTRAPVFWLFDKLLYCPYTADPHRRPPRGGPGPRISFFDDRDAPREPVQAKPKRDPDDARKLCRRLQALMRALKDVDAQALRLRRLLDKRKAEGAKPARTNPMRDGSPPGYRREHTQEVDRILEACDGYAREPAPPEP